MNTLTGAYSVFAFIVTLVGGALTIMLVTLVSSIYLASFLRGSRLSRFHIFCIALTASIAIFASCAVFAAIMGGSVLPGISTSEFTGAIMNGVFIWLTLLIGLLIALFIFRVVAAFVYFVREFIKPE